MAQISNHVNASGYLNVGDGHKLYWEDWGNPKATPNMFLHGGPGSGFADRHKIMFDPAVHRVIFFDQRGSGRSKQLGSLKNNTTGALVEDIEKLRKHLKIEKLNVVGGSWGSTLALCYAIAYAQSVAKMLLWGVWTGRKFEVDLLIGGYAKYIYPEAWQRFIVPVPEANRTSADGIIQFYAAKIHSKQKKEACKYAAEWLLWSASLMSINYDHKSLEQSMAEDDESLIAAKIETQYLANDLFIPENYIYDNISKIRHIPAYVVQGRFDMCTPPISAINLAEAYGPKMKLNIVNAAHKRSDAELRVAVQILANTVLT